MSLGLSSFVFQVSSSQADKANVPAETLICTAMEHDGTMLKPKYMSVDLCLPLYTVSYVVVLPIFPTICGFTIEGSNIIEQRSLFKHDHQTGFFASSLPMSVCKPIQPIFGQFFISYVHLVPQSTETNWSKTLEKIKTTPATPHCHTHMGETPAFGVGWISGPRSPRSPLFQALAVQARRSPRVAWGSSGLGLPDLELHPSHQRYHRNPYRRYLKRLPSGKLR